MIITKEVEMTWNVRTVTYYKEKGYPFTKYGDKFFVKVEDLTPSSRVKIKIRCDYCESENDRPYFRITETLEKSIVSKYSCSKCSEFKIQEEKEERQNNGLIKRNEYRYWHFKENRDREFHKFIKKHGTIDNFSSLDSGLYSAFKKYEEGTLEQVITDLGYIWEEVSSTSPINFYKNFENVENKILDFVKDNNRFPTYTELIKVLSIQQESIQFHGGIDGIKKKMNYCDSKDLIDDLGFNNKSLMEYSVSQFLIKNSVPHLREVPPFVDERYRSDFLISNANGILFFIEVWGYDKAGKSKRATQYNKKRLIKENLYAYHNFNLISIEFDDVERMDSHEFQNYLKKKFENIINNKLVLLDNNEFLHPYWKSDTIYEAFVSITQTNSMPINKESLKNISALDMLEVLPKIYSTHSIAPAKIDFYYQLVNSSKKPINIHEKDVIFLKDISKRRGRSISYVTDKHVKMANEIILKIAL